MKEYITTLIGSVIICSLAAMLSPEDEKGMLGYVRLAAGLCVLCVAIAPISSFLSSVLDFDVWDSFKSDVAGELEYNGVYEQSLLDASEASISDGLQAMLCRDFKLENDDIEVSVELYKENEECKVESVTVIFFGGAFFTDPHEVISYIDELLGCRCEIIYG